MKQVKLVLHILSLLSGPQSCHNLCDMEECEDLYYKHHFVILVYKCCENIANEYQLRWMKIVLCAYFTAGRPSPLPFSFLSLCFPEVGVPSLDYGCPSLCIQALYTHTHTHHTPCTYIHIYTTHTTTTTLTAILWTL